MTYAIKLQFYGTALYVYTYARLSFDINLKKTNIHKWVSEKEMLFSVDKYITSGTY